MKHKTKLLLLAALFVLALPLILIGTASAKYMSDGAVPDGVTGGWVTPNDMMCIVGLHQDGTLDIADGVTSRRDCIYLQTGTMNGGTPFDLTGITTSADCADTDGPTSDGAKHSWATSWCSISLTGLDRTQQMCVGIGGTWVTIGKCVAYGAQFKGQDASGTPLPIGTEGTDSTDPAQGDGFCYTNAMITGIPVGSCPSTSTNASTAFGYSVMGTNCAYSYGIAGDRTSALTKADGTTYGPTVDLSTLTTMGDCLANGASWANWIPASTAATAPGGTATIMTFDLTRQVVDADEGCLHCHSTKTEYNGPAERFKDSYLKTGHKNMLRKVTAGMKMAGPDGVMYDTLGYAVGSINFGTLGNNDATATVGGVDKPLLYLFGDWMAPAPAGLDVVVNMGGAAKYNGGSDYSCAACHTGGWSNTDPAKGLCTLSSKTNAVDCGTAGGTWTPLTGVQAIGTPGYAAKQPGDSFPGITFGAAGQWDVDGITCGRCHNATVPSVTATHIAASAFPQTTPTGGGMGSVPSGPTGTWATKLCFSCHQSIAKETNGTGLNADLAHPENIPVKNTVTAPAYVPEFSGHVLGGSFMNSPHGKATGTIVPNSLGKYDIATATYTSAFKGYMCWQSSTSSSPAKTQANGHEIKDKTTCETLYGAGAWRADTQGNCTTCHDVHQSLFVEGQEALRKECESCHENATYGVAVPAGTQVDTDTFAHPKVSGSPFDTDMYVNACEVCHMPKATSSGFPMHLWRIKADADYSTFPTALEFGIGGAATLKNGRAATADGYANAVWVDLDLACGQCHGGGSAYGQNPIKNGAPYILKNSLADYAKGMHVGNWPAMQPMTTARITSSNDLVTSYKVNFTAAASTCPGGDCTYSWDFENDGITDTTGATVSKTYTDSTMRVVKLTVKNNVSKATNSTTKEVTPEVKADLTPTADFSPVVAGLGVTLTDLSTGANKIIVKWGDGTSNTYSVPLPTISHTYATSGVYKILYTAKSAAGLYNTKDANLLTAGTQPVKVTVSELKYSITVTGLPAGVKVVLKKNGATKEVQTSTISDTIFLNRKAGSNYKIKVYKLGTNFDCDGAGILINASPVTIGPDATVTCTIIP